MAFIHQIFLVPSGQRSQDVVCACVCACSVCVGGLAMVPSGAARTPRRSWVRRGHRHGGVKSHAPLGVLSTEGALYAGGSGASWEKRREGLGRQSGHCDCCGSPETERIGSMWREPSKELAHTMAEADKSQDLQGKWAGWRLRLLGSPAHD